MAQQLKSCSAFAEDASLIPSTRFVQIHKKELRNEIKEVSFHTHC